MKKGRFSKDEKQFVLDNFANLGVDYVASELDRSVASVQKVWDSANPSVEAPKEELTKAEEKDEYVPKPPTVAQAMMNPRGPGKGITIMTEGVSTLSDELPKAKPKPHEGISVRPIR